MEERISYPRVREIVEKASYDEGLSDGHVSVYKIQAVIAQSIYLSLNEFKEETNPNPPYKK